jgi:thiamine biosynthesis lipoprotein
MSPVEHVEHVMGTAVVFSVHAPDGPEVRAAVAEACAVLHRADDVFSTWKPWSPMSRLRRGAARLDELDDTDAGEIASVLALCLQARATTGGWFDPWALPGGVDPTGVVKGWALEQALAVLDARGLTAMVNGGGDIAWCGIAPDGGWRLGVRHPWVADGLACVVTGDGVNRAIATSAAYERGAHFVDPTSGRRTRGVLASATVVGPDLAVADALATALVVGGRPVLARIEDLQVADGRYEAYGIGHDGSEWWTPGFPFTDVPPDGARRAGDAALAC